jgi:hypothetical protein
MNEQVEAYRRKARKCEHKALLVINNGSDARTYSLHGWRDMARYVASVEERRGLKGPQLP